MNKFERVAELISERASEKIWMLDIGCRRQGLKDYVGKFGRYSGADLFQTGTVEFVGDFTKGLPLAEKEVDVSIALDVIEHTENMTDALDEMVRVTKKFAIVMLPNHAHFFHRLSFLFTTKINDKWTIKFPLSLDRHRWLTTASNSDSYMREYAADRGLLVECVPSKIGFVGSIMEKSLGRIWPDFWLRQRLYVLSRR